MPVRLRSAFVFLLFFGVPLMADVTGRWTAGGTEVFVLRQVGDAVTGVIQGRPGEPAYKIVDGTVRGSRIFFFVLHEDESDPPREHQDPGVSAHPQTNHQQIATKGETREWSGRGAVIDLDLRLECDCLVLLELPWTSTSFRRAAQFPRGSRDK
jgi:hypothetical protein